MRFVYPRLENLIFVGLLAFGITACSSDENEEAPAAAPEVVSEVEEVNAEPADPETFPDIVAIVNGVEIPKTELLERIAGADAQKGGSPGPKTVAYYREILDQLVGAELLYQACRDRDMLATSADVDRELDKLKSRFPQPDRFEQSLEAQGMTLEKLRTEMRRNLSIQKFIETDIASQVSVSTEDVRRFYDGTQDQMRQPEQLRLSHILKSVDPEATTEERATALAAIEDVLLEASSGADFAALAREHSEDLGSAQNGGELTVTRGQTVPPFEQAAFALEPGGLSPVVETQFGYHIIKMLERIEGQLIPYEDVQAQIEQGLKQEAIQSRMQQAIASLKESGEVELFIE